MKKIIKSGIFTAFVLAAVFSAQPQSASAQSVTDNSPVVSVLLATQVLASRAAGDVKGEALCGNPTNAPAAPVAQEAEFSQEECELMNKVISSHLNVTTTNGQEIDVAQLRRNVTAWQALSPRLRRKLSNFDVIELGIAAGN